MVSIIVNTLNFLLGRWIVVRPAKEYYKQIDDHSKIVAELKRRKPTIQYAEQFHEKYNVPIRHTLGLPPVTALRFRMGIIAEEFVELAAALGFRCKVDIQRVSDLDNPDHIGAPFEYFDVMTVSSETKGLKPSSSVLNMFHIIKELVDLDVTVSGTYLTFGLRDPSAYIQQVHESNMSKEGPARSDNFDPSVRKVAKGTNYREPDFIKKGQIIK